MQARADRRGIAVDEAPVLAIGNELRGESDPSRDYREPARECFEEYQPAGLVVARQDEQIGGVVERHDVRMGADQRHAVRYAAASGQLSGLTDHRPCRVTLLSKGLQLAVILKGKLGCLFRR